MIRLEDWHPYTLMMAAAPPAEHEPHVILTGSAFNHPMKEDGAEVSTGKVLSVRVEDWEGRKVIILTAGAGSEYILGMPDRSYEMIFSNAREEIIKHFCKDEPMPQSEAPVAEPEPVSEPIPEPISEVREDMSLTAILDSYNEQPVASTEML